MLNSETSPLSKFNPLCKILFILIQALLIFFFLTQNIAFSILIIIAGIIVTDITLIPDILTMILRFSPLLLSIFLLGYLFGNNWHKDLNILIMLITLLFFSLVLLKTTSAYSFFSQIKALCGNQCHGFIIFLYGIVRFLPIIFYEYSHTLKLYRTQVNRRVNLSSLAELFPLIVHRSLLRVRHVHHSVDQLLSRSESIKLSLYDIVLSSVLIFQFVLLFK